MTSLTIKVLKVDQPIGEFYIGAIQSDVLNSIATVDIREFLDDKAKELAGIQRRLSKVRVKEIGRYVNFDYATFPTSIVIAVDERCVDLRSINGCPDLYELTISEFISDDPSESIPLDQSAFVIDGQHRLAGLEQLANDRKFELNVSIFVGADLADKAEIFSTVNLAQTKVNRSLVYDLFAYAKAPSPFKTAHEITIALDREDGGPLAARIKRLGVATPGRSAETLSQATVVRGILRHLPKDPDVERNKGFLGLSRQPANGESWRQQIFAPFYRNDDTVSIFRIMSNYFSAVRETWPTAWADDDEGAVLNKTNGYDALMRFLQNAYLSIVSDRPRVVKEDEFGSIFRKMKVPANKFNVENFPPGSSGASQLYKLFMSQSEL